MRLPSKEESAKRIAEGTENAITKFINDYAPTNELEGQFLKDLMDVVVYTAEMRNAGASITTIITEPNYEDVWFSSNYKRKETFG